MDYEEFEEEVKRRVKALWRETHREANDEIIGGYLFATLGEEPDEIMQLVVPDYVMQVKDEAFEILAAICRAFETQQVAFSAEAWMSVRPKDIDWQDRPAPSEDPDRIEVVTITVAGKDRSSWWSAKIVRGLVGVPALTQWEGGDDEAGPDQSIGLIGDAMRLAVR